MEVRGGMWDLEVEDEKNMKIVFLSRYQTKNMRGAESFVKELSQKLSKNHQVQVFAGKESDSLSRVLAGKFDVVVPINGRWQALKMSWGRVIGGYKVLISGHSGIGRDDLWNILMTRPNVFVALTDQMAKWAKQFAFGVKIVKIPNGIDLEKFTSTGQKVELRLERPIILSVGALEWYKHHQRAIEAVSRLDVGSLVIAGEGAEHQKLMDLGKLKLGNRFKITQFDYDDMPKIYRSADLFTLPSWDREAFGLVYLEAMASGLSVVAPDDLSRREIVGDGGILVDVSNIDKYVEAINKALKTNWGSKPRNQAEKFSWNKIANQYEKELESL